MSLTKMKKQLGEFCETQQCETCTLCQFECTHDGENFHIRDDQLVLAYKTVFSSAPSIKDSGERRQFDTGAVRDIQEGKGRCDLMPLDVVAIHMENHVLLNLASFQETANIDYLYKCLISFSCNFDDGKCKASPEEIETQRYCTMFLEVAKHFEDGAKKYGENNWQKGIPVRCYIDSAVRHYLKWLRDDKDESHDRAFCWNILCAIWTCKHKPELNDYNKEETEE